MTTRIVIVDDQAVIRTGLRSIFETHPDLAVVGEASDGDQAIHVATHTRPDLVLMDIRMPGTDGVEATRRLAGPDVDDPTSVLIVTTFDLDEYVFGALRAGASGFLLKDTEPDELVGAVRTVAAGHAMVAPSVTRSLIEEFVKAVPADPVAGDLDELSSRELDVLTLIARGLSNAEIADELFVEVSTVKSHVGRIFAKLGVRDRVQAVITAYEHGIVRPGA
jgi:DNA-binding NarL/FixJ family response regulator